MEAFEPNRLKLRRSRLSFHEQANVLIALGILWSLCAIWLWLQPPAMIQVAGSRDEVMRIENSYHVRLMLRLVPFLAIPFVNLFLFGLFRFATAQQRRTNPIRFYLAVTSSLISILVLLIVFSI